MGIVKNRFGPRKHTTILNIDYPTLTLSESEEVDLENPRPKAKNPNNIADKLESDFDDDHSTSSLDVLNTLEKLDLLNESQ